MGEILFLLATDVGWGIVHVGDAVIGLGRWGLCVKKFFKSYKAQQ